MCLGTSLGKYTSLFFYLNISVLFDVFMAHFSIRITWYGVLIIKKNIEKLYIYIPNIFVRLSYGGSVISKFFTNNSSHDKLEEYLCTHMWNVLLVKF